MNTAERLSYNAGYLNITVEQAEEHERLMGAQISTWPAELRAYLEQCKPGCGDALSCAVADWLRS